MTISEVYHELIEEGKTKNKAAEICLGVMTSGLIDATDEETYERMMGTLSKVDLSEIIESEDETDLKGELACAGGACEIV